MDKVVAGILLHFHINKTPRCSVQPPFGVPAAHYHTHLRRGEMSHRACIRGAGA
jgi:hypothetical protein